MKTHALAAEAVAEDVTGLLREGRLDLLAAQFEGLSALQLAEKLDSLIGSVSAKVVFEFVSLIANQKNHAIWHKAAAKIALERLSGDAQLLRQGMAHLLKAVEETPEDWQLKAFALHFAEDGMLPKPYAKHFAEAVLKVEPANRVALSVSESFRKEVLIP